MEYINERIAGIVCAVTDCPWHNLKYKQHCQAEFNGERHLADCVEYTPIGIIQVEDY